MKTIQVRGKEYTLYSFTGQVVGTSKNLETTVSGGGGGGSGGSSAPVSISSITTVHDQFFLTDNSGKERAFQLNDFDLACREGHKLTVVWTIKKGEERGPYIAVRNHTTGQTFYGESQITTICNPQWRTNLTVFYCLLFLVLFVVAIVKFVGRNLLGGAMVAVIAAIIGIDIVRRMMSYDREIKQFKSQIAFD